MSSGNRHRRVVALLASLSLAACGSTSGGGQGRDGTPGPDRAPPSAGSAPAAQYVPHPTGTCPTFAAGDVTVAPAGVAARKVRIWIDPAAAARAHGPLVFYWHGTGSSPAEAVHGLGQAVIDQITALGGIVAAPYSDPASRPFPWFLVSSSRLDDLVVADEVLACALQSVGFDLRHVHSVGMSAGGLQTAQMSYRRSGYLASVVTYSGGLLPRRAAPPRQDPSNKLAALIFHGGASDVVMIDFQAASEAYWADLTANGQFAAICDHGRGHAIPTDAAGSVWAFLQAHPFGTNPSPYAAGLPAGFPSYCALSP